MPVEKITVLYAYIATDDKNEEGLCAFKSNVGWIPMVGADLARLEVLRPFAETVAKESNKRVELRRFVGQEIVEIIHPNGVRS